MQRASLRAFNRTKHLDLVCSSHPAPLLSQRTWPFEAALAGLASLAGSGLSLSTPTCLAQLSSSLLSPTNETAYHAFIFFIPPLFRKATFRVPAAARAARSGRRPMLVTGGSSLKASGRVGELLSALSAAGLEVTMNDAGRVRLRQRIRNLNPVLQRFVQLQPLAAD